MNLKTSLVAITTAATVLLAAPTQALAADAEPTISLLPAPQGLASDPDTPAGWTAYSMPELAGTADPGAVATLTVDGSAVPMSRSGSAWTATMTSDLADGQHTAVLTTTPADGTVSAQATLTFHIDTTPPSQPTLVAPLDNTFYNHFPTFSEVADSSAGLPSPGMRVQFFYTRVNDRNGTPVTPSEAYGPKVQADADGVATWAEPTRSTANGRWTWYSRVSDEVGNGTVSDDHSFVIDTVAPPAPTIDTPLDPTDVTTLSGTLPVDPNYTDPYPDAPMDAPDSTFKVNVDGQTYTDAILDPAAGTWSLTLDAALAPAPEAHTITASWGDAAGNWSTPAVISVYDPVPLTAADDTAATTASTSVTVDALRNDSGPAGLALAGVSGTSGTWSVADNKVVYIPASGFTGTASGTYTVSDAMDAQTSTGTITVLVTYLPFSVKADSAVTDYGRAATVDVLANDVKPAGTVVVSAAGPAAQGTWKVSSGRVVFMPRARFVRVATGTYVAKAPDGRTLTGAVTVRVTPQIHQSNGDLDTVSGANALPVVFVGQKSSPRPQGWGTTLRAGNTVDRNATGKTGSVNLALRVIGRTSRKPVPAGLRVALRNLDGTPFTLHPAVAHTTAGGWASFTINPANATKTGTYKFKAITYAGKGFAAHDAATTWLIRVVR